MLPSSVGSLSIWGGGRWSPGVGRGWEGRLWAYKESGVRAREPRGRSLTVLVQGGSLNTEAGVRLDILEQRLVVFADDCGMGVSFVPRAQE